MSDATKKQDMFWKVATVLLVVVVSVQIVVMYYALSRKNNFQQDRISQGDGDVVIRPRVDVSANYPQQQKSTQTQSSSVNALSQSQLLKPAPLPKLNLNLNAMSGISPSSQSLPQQQPQNMKTQPLISSQMTPRINRMMRTMGGFSRMNIQEEFERMQKMMDQMFSNHGMAVAMNHFSSARGLSMKSAVPTLTQDSRNYIVKLTVPGLDRSAINAEVSDNILTLSGIQKEETEENSQYGRSYSSSSSSFRNSFSLPGPIKSDGMKVNYENSILTVTVPKA